MHIARGVAMLEVSATVLGKAVTVFPTLLWDDQTALLIDAGLPGHHAQVATAFARHQVDVQKLDTIVLTHQDIDHIGGASGLSAMVANGVRILCDSTERPYIEGVKRPLKLSPEAINKALAALPNTVPAHTRTAFRAVLENPPTLAVDATISAGDELPRFGGLSVIGTPGHTPGHVAIHHRLSRCVILGDCVDLVDGRLRLPDEKLCSDFEQARRSLRNLLDYDIDSAIAYHGGLIDKSVRFQLEALSA